MATNRLVRSALVALAAALVAACGAPAAGDVVSGSPPTEPARTVDLGRVVEVRQTAAAEERDAAAWYAAAAEAEWYAAVAAAEAERVEAQRRAAAEEQRRREAEETRRRTAVAASTQARSVPSGSVWDRLAECESGGEWTYGPHSTWGSRKYEGGLQFHPTTWDSYKPAGYPEAAYQASREQQIVVGERVQAAQGWGAWPACARELGLL